MDETVAKHHHLIPRTYLSAWEHGGGTLYILDRNDGKLKERNKDKFAEINDYYSIVAGMPIVTQEDAECIYAALKDYVVWYDGEIISSAVDLNNKYAYFEQWDIRRKDGSQVRKAGIRSQIQNVKIKDIERLWSTKYENRWNDVRGGLTERINTSVSNRIPAYEREYLIKFYTALDWRSIKSNAVFQAQYNPICDALQLQNMAIPVEDRLIPSIKTGGEELRHSILLKYYRQFLNDEGVMYIDAMKSLSCTSFHFLVADGIEKFNTSDNPAFAYVAKDGKQLGVLPISPHILMIKGGISDSDYSYTICHITDEDVRKFNSIIYQNAENYIVQYNRQI